jgi:hypothetical protein
VNAELSQDLTKARQEIILSTKPVLALVQSLEIKDAASYTQADNLLTKIRGARKLWKDKTSKFLDPLKAALKNVKDSISEANSFIGEVDGPLEVGEDQLREGMRQYKMEEVRQEQERKRKQQEETDRLNREAEEKRRKAEAAKTPQMAARLANQAARLETEAVKVETAPVAAPVQVSGSGTRTTRKIRVVNLKHFLVGVCEGQIPEEFVKVDAPLLNLYHKARLAEVEAWPGCEGYDDVTIVGSRR